MWKAIAELVEETGLDRSAFLHAIKNEKIHSAARQAGKIWMIDDEHPDYLSWWHKKDARGRPRFSKVVIIKASIKDSDHPVWVEIRRVGASMSDLKDSKNHLGLNDEQEAAYRQAWQLVAEGDIPAAESKLKECFDWVKVEM